MARRQKESTTTESVSAIFDPVGIVKVNLTAPSGKEYRVPCREPFEIAAEDVNFFFVDWDWQFRQYLKRADERKAEASSVSPEPVPGHSAAEYKDETVGADPGYRNSYRAYRDIGADALTAGRRPEDHEKSDVPAAPEPEPIDEESEE